MRIARWLPVFAWAGLIFTLSSLSNPPGATGNEWQSNLAHMTEYAVLATLLWRWLAGLRGARSIVLRAAVTWFACVAYGASDEFHQSFVPNRDANVMDVGFDALGSGLALAAVTTKAYLHNRRTQP